MLETPILVGLILLAIVAVLWWVYRCSAADRGEYRETADCWA
jgi:hypothetical protein